MSKVLSREDYICKDCIRQANLSQGGACWWDAVCRACGHARFCTKLGSILPDDTLVLTFEDGIFEMKLRSELPRVTKLSSKSRSQIRYEQCRTIDAQMQSLDFWIVHVEIQRRQEIVLRYVVLFEARSEYGIPVKAHLSQPPDLERRYSWSEIKTYRLWINGVPYIAEKAAR